MTVIFRLLKPDDAEEFFALRLYGAVQSADFFRMSPGDVEKVSVEEWRQRLVGDADRVVGAFQADKLVGIGGLTQMLGDKLSHKGLIWGMYVHESAQGLGIGSHILKALIACAQPIVQSLQLTLAADNEKARHLYESFGFIAYSLEPKAYSRGNGYADELSMWLPLDETL